jgi:hypothetical protein
MYRSPIAHAVYLDCPLVETAATDHSSRETRQIAILCWLFSPLDDESDVLNFALDDDYLAFPLWLMQIENRDVG